MIEIDPSKASGKELYFLMISAIVPRPIAWISTKGKDGTTNLAPFSYFQGITSKPPMISVSIGHRRWNDETVRKDTLKNIEETGEFVVNVPTEEQGELVTLTSTEYAPGESEIEKAGLTTIPSDIVAAPRIKECPIHFECRLDQVVWCGKPKPVNGLVIAEVVKFHISESVWDAEKNWVDVEKLHPLSRLAGQLYGKTREVFEVVRPDWKAKGVKA